MAAHYRAKYRVKWKIWTPGSVRISQEHACGGGREISDGLRTTDDGLSMRGAIDGSASRVLNRIWFEAGGTLL